MSLPFKRFPDLQLTRVTRLKPGVNESVDFFPLRPGALCASPFALCPLPFTLARMSLLQVAVMLAAAFIAGMVNSIAGGGTLLTFPLLIWLGTRSESRERDQHRRALAGTVRWAVWLSPRDERQLFDPDAPGSDQCDWRRSRRLASDRDAITDVRAPGAVSDFVRDGSVHAAGSGESLAAFAERLRRFDQRIGGRLRSSCSFFRRCTAATLAPAMASGCWRRWACSVCTTSIARTASRTFSASASTASRCWLFRFRIWFCGQELSLMAVAALARRLCRRAHGAASGPCSHSPRDRGDWICDYGRDAVADEVKNPVVSTGARSERVDTQACDTA